MPKLEEMGPDAQRQVIENVQSLLALRRNLVEEWLRRAVGFLLAGNGGGLIATVSFVGASGVTKTSLDAAVLPLFCFGGGLGLVAAITLWMLVDAILDTRAANESAERVFKSEVDFPKEFEPQHSYSRVTFNVINAAIFVSAAAFFAGLWFGYEGLVQASNITSS